MPYTVTIKDTLTGEVRSYQDTMGWDDSSSYLWSDGNYGCDCNRGAFFARAGGDPDPDHPCGDDRFHVTITDCDVTLYQDDTP